MERKVIKIFGAQDNIQADDSGDIGQQSDTGLQEGCGFQRYHEYIWRQFPVRRGYICCGRGCAEGNGSIGGDGADVGRRNAEHGD